MPGVQPPDHHMAMLNDAMGALRKALVRVPWVEVAFRVGPSKETPGRLGIDTLKIAAVPGYDKANLHLDVEGDVLVKVVSILDKLRASSGPAPWSRCELALVRESPESPMVLQRARPW